jgi:hypothetical protein
VAGEHDGATLHMYGDVFGPRGSTLCVKSPKWYPQMRLQETFSTQSGGSFRCAEYVTVRGRVFLDYHELPVVP